MTFETLSMHLDNFLAMKHRADGETWTGSAARTFRYTERLLRNFLECWRARGCASPIRASFASEWVTIGTQAQHPYRDQHRIWAIRAFLTHVRAFEPGTEIPPNIFRVGRARRRPYVFSDEELTRLVHAPYHLRLFDPLRPITLATLVGLLASTGLRIGEALRLTDADVQLEADPPHVLILETKFGKSRIVALHASTAERLRAYASARAAVLQGRRPSVFFTTRLGRPLSYSPTLASFRRLLRHARIQPASGARPPSFHSLRHSFAVNRLTQWYREGRDAQEWLPHLSVYLGHLSPTETYWYLSGTAELLRLAAERAQPDLEGGGQ
jgi:integrase